LRTRRVSWETVRERPIYQYRNSFKLAEHADLDEDTTLGMLISGVYGHCKHGEEMLEKVKNFVRECNSPGYVDKPTRLLLQKINSKDTGVFRLKELEDAADASLQKSSDSTNSSGGREIQELKNNLQQLAEDYSSPSTESRDLHERKHEANELTRQMIESGTAPEEVVESIGTGLDEKLSDLIDLKEEEAQLKYGISQQAGKLTSYTSEDSTNNQEQGEEDL